MDIDLPLDHFDLSPEIVRSRFRLALRRGNPQWLWPAAIAQSWQEALCQIEQVTRLILSGSKAHITFEGPADDIGIAAFTSGMGPLLGYWIAQGLLIAETPVRSVLLLHYDHNSRRMERLRQRSITAVKALAAAGVGVTVLKGMHTAYSYFPEPGTRPASDIDLLIEPSKEPVAAQVLRGLGYLPGATSYGERTWRMNNVPSEPRSLSLTHQDNPWSIDLHTTLNRRYSPGAPLVALDEAIDKSIRNPWSLARAGTVLPPSELVLHLAFHASTNFVSTTMLRLTELILVIQSIDSNHELFWNKFLILSDRTGSAGSTYPALYFANRFVPGTVPDTVLCVLAERAPVAVRQVVSRLTPATCHRILRCSLGERFMWTETLGGWVREAWGTLFPPVSFKQLAGVYKCRASYLLRGSITR